MNIYQINDPKRPSSRGIRYLYFPNGNGEYRMIDALSLVAIKFVRGSFCYIVLEH
jgi:hypothetical protein